MTDAIERWGVRYPSGHVWELSSKDSAQRMADADPTHLTLVALAATEWREVAA